MQDASLEMLSIFYLERLLGRVRIVELNVGETFSGAGRSIDGNVHLSYHVSIFFVEEVEHDVLEDYV